jgi:serpin B
MATRPRGHPHPAPATLNNAMNPKTLLTPLASLALLTAANAMADPDIAAQATNALGLDLYRQVAPDTGNSVLSPYSIQSALAMTYAGARGGTREEMRRVLHYPADDEALHRGFEDLRRRLADIAERSQRRAQGIREHGGEADAIALHVANRLFGQKGYPFRDTFLALTGRHYGADLLPLDFEHDPDGARATINGWVEEQTRERIRDLLPPDAIDNSTGLVLVNALYLKAPWAEPFQERNTEDLPFRVEGGEAVPVPTMRRTDDMGYLKGEGFTAVSLPYEGRGLQFVVLLPDAPGGVADLVARVDTNLLAQLARLPSRKVRLFLPRVKVEGSTIALADALMALGMRQAFDHPQGSADFDGIAARQPDDYLRIDEVYHKTFLDLDEKGTEAAAATAVAMMRATAIERPEEPVEVRVDHPFLFAIQERETGACLFYGRIGDPR